MIKFNKIKIIYNYYYMNPTKNNIIIISLLIIFLILFIIYFSYNLNKTQPNNFDSQQPNNKHRTDQHHPTYIAHDQTHIDHDQTHIDQQNHIVSRQPNHNVSHQPKFGVTHPLNNVIIRPNKINRVENFDNTNNYKAGLEFKILEGYHNENANFANLAGVKGGLGATSGVSSIIDSLSTGTSKIIKGTAWGGEGVEAHNFTVYWYGFFYTGNNPKGDWTFWTNSDDGSYLWVDSQLIVNNGSPHGMQEKSGVITLNTNQYYPIKILFGEIGGGFDMRVSFQGPNVGRRTDGNGFYFSTSPSLPAGLEFKILEGYHNENANFANLAGAKGGLGATLGVSSIIDSLSTGTSKIIKGMQLVT
jgi:hypothetical protein